MRSVRSRNNPAQKSDSSEGFAARGPEGGGGRIRSLKWLPLQRNSLALVEAARRAIANVFIANLFATDRDEVEHRSRCPIRPADEEMKAMPILSQVDAVVVLEVTRHERMNLFRCCEHVLELLRRNQTDVSDHAHD